MHGIMCLPLPYFFLLFLAQQYPTEDEDDDYYDGVDLLNLFIAMTLLGSGGDYDDDDDEDFDFAFYLSGEYGF